jgi:hypothetical protein
MKTFSPSEAALEGFRLTRERPGTILVWGGVYFMGVVAMASVLALGLGPKFRQFLKGGGLDSGDVEGIADLLLRSWPAFLIALLIAFLILAVITAGIYRLVLRPEEPGLAHLRFGADEFRLAILNTMLFAMGFVFVALIEMILQVLLSSQTQNSALTALGLFLGACLMIWIGVRLSLATPMTFGRRKISISEAWRLSRGHFWSLLGAIVLALIFYLMIWVLISIIGYSIVAFAGGEATPSNPLHMSPVQIVALAVTLVIQLLLPILQIVTLYAPLAVAYKALSAEADDAAAAGLPA